MEKIVQVQHLHPTLDHSPESERFLKGRPLQPRRSGGVVTVKVVGGERTVRIGKGRPAPVLLTKGLKIRKKSNNCPKILQKLI